MHRKPATGHLGGTRLLNNNDVARLVNNTNTTRCSRSLGAKTVLAMHADATVCECDSQHFFEGIYCLGGITNSVTAFSTRTPHLKMENNNA